MTTLPVVVGRDDADIAGIVAERIREELTRAVEFQGVARAAFSGGTTPWLMIQRLAEGPLPWERIDIFQVDERCVDPADARSNARHFSAFLPPEARFHRVPVDRFPDPEEAAQAYEQRLISLFSEGDPVFDVVHLGLGNDGHTASLVPHDPILQVKDRWVAPTAFPYQGARRVSLTFPTLARSRRILWLVTGSAKRDILHRFLDGDPRLPAAQVPREHATLYTDPAAFGATHDADSPAGHEPPPFTA